jgi:molybdate transport system ATP-binding protein
VSRLILRGAVDRRGVDLEFSVGAGEVLAVLGPNGAGKSTVLRVIAGLIRPDRGLVQVGERVLTDTARGTFVPTCQRRVGLLQQDPLLFPHLDVAANVAFGPRCQRGRRHAAGSAEHWLALVGVADLAGRNPRKLSGGQAQRVALARALAAEPDVLLLDEPMAGLDVAAATAMRALLREVLTRDGRSAVLITHDLADALTLADRVLVLESGRIAELGATAAVLTAPRSRFGARIAGVNLVSGTASGGGVLATAWGSTWHGNIEEGVAVGGPAVAVFSPGAVAVYQDEPHGSPRNTARVMVAELDNRGPAIRLRAHPQPDGAVGLAADVTLESAAELGLEVGMWVYFSVKAQEVSIHPGVPSEGSP